MKINELIVKNYRNYNEERIIFDPNINILFGNNAQGKTNILESIYLCSTSKSHRTSKNNEIIKFGEDESHITIKFEKDNLEQVIDVHLKNNNKKGIAINKIPIKQVGELIGTIFVVMFSPEDLGIIKNGPLERRKFIDRELCQINKLYYYELKKYNKILKQRNALLKQIQTNQYDKDQLIIWDQQLIETGKKIIKFREDFISSLTPIIKKNHFKISGEQEKLNIIYDKNCTIDNYEKKFFKYTDYDIKIGSTTVGPHKDDIIFKINEVDVRQFGSQGQQRTVALSLKLSEIEIIKRLCNITPILLLDDVLSELDKHRQKYLMDCIKDVQTILTCTGIEDLLNSQLNIGEMYTIEKGKIKKYTK